jgi:hypothetical protein
MLDGEERLSKHPIAAVLLLGVSSHRVLWPNRAGQRGEVYFDLDTRTRVRVAVGWRDHIGRVDLIHRKGGAVRMYGFGRLPAGVRALEHSDGE